LTTLLLITEEDFSVVTPRIDIINLIKETSLY